jgi:hypothetical protein
MEDVVLYRALEAFCRQRARMEGEGLAFWLEEAENMAKRVMSESVPAAFSDEEKRPPELGAQEGSSFSPLS